MPSAPLNNIWAADTEDIVGPHTPPSRAADAPLASEVDGESLRLSSAMSAPAHGVVETCDTPYGVSAEQLEALSAMAFLVGSPLQRQQPSGSAATHPALLVAAKLLQQGVDAERIIQLVECRYTTPTST